MNITNLSNLFNQFIDVPSSDPDDSRRRKLLNILLMGMAALSIFTILVVGIWPIFVNIEDVKNLWLGLASAMGLLLGMAIFYLINRNQHLPGWIASSLFLIFLMLMFAFTDSPAELANGRSLFIFTVPIVMTSILLRPESSFIFALFSSVEVGILATISGRSINTFAMVGFFLVAFISWLSSRSLEQALKDLRTINTNLDRLVTDRTQALSEALTRERIESGRNQAILDSIADGVIVFDAKNVAILANPALSHLIETPLQNLMGNKLNDFINTEKLSPASRDTMADLIERPENSVPGFRIEWGKKTLSASIANVQDTTGENIGTVAVFRDISREADLEKMKETFVAVVSHELRTPLSAIMGHAEMLKESVYGQLNDQQKSITERILVNGNRLLGMVGDLLDEAQIRAGKLLIKPQVFKTSSLLEIMHSTMDKIATDKDLYLTSQLDPNMPNDLTGDPQRLQQILINLVNNAIKFTKKGGIHVHIFRQEPQYWILEVTDSGIGIPEHELSNIFEAFRQVDEVTTRHHGGSGLGLSIVKQLIELMRGEVKVVSKTGHGSTFTVTLPMESS